MSQTKDLVPRLLCKKLGLVEGTRATRRMPMKGTLRPQLLLSWETQASFIVCSWHGVRDHCRPKTRTKRLGTEIIEKTYTPDKQDTSWSWLSLDCSSVLWVDYLRYFTSVLESCLRHLLWNGNWHAGDLLLGSFGMKGEERWRSWPMTLFPQCLKGTCWKF